MRSVQVCTLLLAALVAASGAEMDLGRKLLQTVAAGTPASLTVSAADPIVNAITITLARPYPQNGFFCNVTGDPRIPQQGPFPLTVKVPVGVTSTVVFANITGPIPGSSCAMGSSVVQQPGQSSSVVQQPGQSSSVVQQPGPSSSVVQQQGGTSVVQQKDSKAGTTSIQQLVNNPSSVMQQTEAGATVVQQQYATSINQQNPDANQYLSCSGGTSSPSVVQQQAAPASVVQQQQGPPASVVQQQGPPASVVQQQQGPPASVVQQQSPPASVVQQQGPPASVVQQESSPSVVQQSPIVQQGRRLLQVGTIEFISNNGSTGEPELTVLDTSEGVPNISFKPTAAGQTAQFNGALQVAVTTTQDGFGTPYIPYEVDSRLSPQCSVQVNFVAV